MIVDTERHSHVGIACQIRLDSTITKLTSDHAITSTLIVLQIYHSFKYQTT